MSPRFKPLSQHDMSLDQQRVAQAVAGGPRGGLRGPFHALLRSPELADRVRHLGDYVRFESTVPAALRELAILLVARFWTSHYEWNAHRRHAGTAGLDPSIADAIEIGKRPASLSADETLVYDLQRQKALCLNQIAAWVWQHCDGQTTIEELAVRMHWELDVPADERVARLALHQLSKAKLLVEPFDEPAWAARHSRRRLLRTFGTLIALPAVMSIAAPRASAATSIRCPAGQTACGGVCVNTQTDNLNCGSCSNMCASLGANLKCVGGRCLPGGCASGFVCKTVIDCPNSAVAKYICVNGCCNRSAG